MKDRLFSGPDVGEALAVAAASLGLPRAELRYVVLDPGTAGGRGLKPTPARIAVLLREASGPSAPLPREGEPAPASPPDPLARLRETIRAVAEAGGLDVEPELEEGEEAVVVRLRGPDQGFFLGPDGTGEVLRATEHLLQRLHGAALQPRFLRLTCEGFRERRDQALAEEARRLAEAVRADGEPREMAPLNAYERRVIHVALQDEPGVTTFSVGEGSSRRVTVAPDGTAPPGTEAPDGAE
ncbi:MAG TPA: R3H domain-containing nucleic acid-binding protein [Vicinamibacteria bacterium]|nr:R3H domain-containing nucleic acid-binding protein [Vicinamibacteria bacterium]